MTTLRSASELKSDSETGIDDFEGLYIRSSSGVADNVGIALLEAESGGGVNASVHAPKDDSE